MVDESFEPNGTQEAVLDHLKDGREDGEPWGYTTVSIAGRALERPRQSMSRALKPLREAGWVTREEPTGTGVYRFVEDPREEEK